MAGSLRDQIVKQFFDAYSLLWPMSDRGVGDATPQAEREALYHNWVVRCVHQGHMTGVIDWPYYKRKNLPPITVCLKDAVITPDTTTSLNEKRREKIGQALKNDWDTKDGLVTITSELFRITANIDKALLASQQKLNVRAPPLPWEKIKKLSEYFPKAYPKRLLVTKNATPPPHIVREVKFQGQMIGMPDPIHFVRFMRPEYLSLVDSVIAIAASSLFSNYYQMYFDMYTKGKKVDIIADIKKTDRMQFIEHFNLKDTARDWTWDEMEYYGDFDALHMQYKVVPTEDFKIMVALNFAFIYHISRSDCSPWIIKWFPDPSAYLPGRGQFRDELLSPPQDYPGKKNDTMTQGLDEMRAFLKDKPMPDLDMFIKFHKTFVNDDKETFLRPEPSVYKTTRSNILLTSFDWNRGVFYNTSSTSMMDTWQYVDTYRVKNVGMPSFRLSEAHFVPQFVQNPRDTLLWHTYIFCLYFKERIDEKIEKEKLPPDIVEPNPEPELPPGEKPDIPLRKSWGTMEESVLADMMDSWIATGAWSFMGWNPNKIRFPPKEFYKRITYEPSRRKFKFMEAYPIRPVRRSDAFSAAPNYLGEYHKILRAQWEAYLTWVDMNVQAQMNPDAKDFYRLPGETLINYDGTKKMENGEEVKNAPMDFGIFLEPESSPPWWAYLGFGFVFNVIGDLFGSDYWEAINGVVSKVFTVVINTLLDLAEKVLDTAKNFLKDWWWLILIPVGIIFGGKLAFDVTEKQIGIT